MRHINRKLLFSVACATAAVLLCGCLTSRHERAAVSASATQGSRAVDWQGPIEVGGTERSYFLHIPPSYDSSTPVPLVVVFHGERGSGQEMARRTRFSELSDEKGFIVVYPDGLDGHWNDGRPRRHGETAAPDDVGFVATLIDRLSLMFAIDRNCVYAVGMSNGGMFAQRLGCELSSKIAAIASVAGPLPKDLADKCTPGEPVSVMMIHGTDDDLVPYAGGEVRGDIRGEVLSVRETALFWGEVNHCEDRSVEPGDGSEGDRVRVERWSNGRGGSAVVLYTVEGGGHTWPGAPRGRIGQRVLGPASQTFDATRAIWEFLELRRKWQKRS